MRHNSVVSGHLKSTGILRVDWLSMGPLGFGASQLGIRAYVYKYLGLDRHGFKSCIHCAF